MRLLTPQEAELIQTYRGALPHVQESIIATAQCIAVKYPQQKAALVGGFVLRLVPKVA